MRRPGDRLGVFLRTLGDLRSFRIQAKAAVRELDGTARRNLEALQQTFKILINSFYGYLGFGLGHFNDFVQANAVTRGGRELIQAAVAALEDSGAQVIEVDTDGIYFVAPPGVERRGCRAESLMRTHRRRDARRRPAGDRRALPRDVLLQDEELCTARRGGRDDDSRLGAALARPGAVSAPFHGSRCSA